ncbi:DUF308 domain-containing protein [Georgenia sp. MJ173]|uniref:HdeD family acid-resistance protein n=1 Tax=Georgenia sunbinii TaxID=3117728 RepID=UPI002F2694BA
MTSTSDARSPLPTFSALARQLWYLPVIRGVLGVVLGIVVLVWPSIAVLTIVTLLGVYWLIDGVLSVVDGIRRRGTPGAGWEILFGVVGAVAGLVLIIRPGMSAALLIMLAGVWAIAGGVVLAITAVAARKAVGAGWGWGVFLGLATVAFGVVLVAVPDLTATVLGIVLGIYAIVAGVLFIALGFAIRTLGKRAAPA